MTNHVDVARKLRGSGDRLFGNSFGGGSVKAMDIIRESINVAYDYDELFDHLADLSWDWTCSNCDADLTDRYEDLDIKTPKELGLFH